MGFAQPWPTPSSAEREIRWVLGPPPADGRKRAANELFHEDPQPFLPFARDTGSSEELG